MGAVSQLLQDNAVNARRAGPRDLVAPAPRNLGRGRGNDWSGPTIEEVGWCKHLDPVVKCGLAASHQHLQGRLMTNLLLCGAEAKTGRAARVRSALS